MPGVLNGDYPKPSWDKPLAILGPDGQPYEGERGGTATDRFAQRYRIPRGPESAFALPQVLTFASVLGSSYRNYYHGQYDEAMRFSQEDALAMRNDAYVMALLNERTHAVASRRWHFEVDNPKDAWEKALRDGMTRLARMIPRWSRLTLSGLQAIWFGRAGDQLVPKFKPVKLPALPRTATGGGLPAISVAPSEGEMQTREALCIVNHLPIEGDKIDYDFDGNPYILITPMAANRLLEDDSADVRQWNGKEWVQAEYAKENLWPNIRAKHAEFGYTTIGGRALYLKGTWRDRFRIHKHDCFDTSFFQPWKASAVHGVGIRSVIFWYWWLRQEFLANVTDWCARTGLGVRIWYYESGNVASENAVDQAARDQTQQVNIKVPYTPGEQRDVLDFQETSGTGADLLLRIVKHVEDYLERYIVGQSMSGGGEEFSGFGDRGRSKLASDTKYQITKLDAANFADTNTDELFAEMKRWTYPELADVPLRMVYDVDDPEIETWTKGAKDFVDMGGELNADEARSRLGLSKPGPDDETIGGMEALQAKQATSGHIKPPAGMAPGSSGVASATPDSNGAQEKASADQPPDSESAKWRMQEDDCKLYYSGTAQPYVHEQLAEDYPEDALADWMDEVEWTGPARVDLDEIDFSGADSWRATKEPEKVARFAKRITRGKMKPVILIKKPGNAKYIVADGHHRTLAYRRLKRPVMAWVGETPRSKGPWDHLHNAQFHGHQNTAGTDSTNGANGANGANGNGGNGVQTGKATDKQGGMEPNIDKARLQAADFITLPQGQTGTNCGNCRFNTKGVCQHPSIKGQKVNDRNCCALWDSDGTLRDWKYAQLYAEDARGQEHKPAGSPEGGQFTGKPEDGQSPDDMANKLASQPAPGPVIDIEALKQKATAAYPKFQMIGRKFAKTLNRADIDADDLAQEGFTAVLQALPKYDESKGEFDGWAYRVAYRGALDVLRKKGINLKQFGPDFDQGDIAEPEPSVHPSTAAGVAKLKELIHGLPNERDRRIMQGKLEGKTDRKIAEDSGIDHTTVSRTVKRVGDQMRQQLQPAEQFAEALEALRYICEEVPDQYADGRSGEYRVHKGRSIEHAVERLKGVDFDSMNDEGDVERVVAAIAKQFTSAELGEVCEQFGVGGLRLKGKMIEAIIKKLIESLKEAEEEAEKKAKEEAKRQAELDRAQAERDKAQAEKYAAERAEAEKAQREQAEREERQRAQDAEEAQRYREAEEKAQTQAVETGRADRLEKAIEALALAMAQQKPPVVRIDAGAIGEAVGKAVGEAIKGMPQPKVEVNVPKSQPKTVTIKRNKDGTFEAKTDAS